MKRRIGQFLCILMAWIFCMPVSAANAGRFLRAGYEVEGNRLQIMGVQLPAGGELKVTVGTQRDVSVQLRTVEEAGLPTTVYCLADVSGSMKEEQMEQMRGVMCAISDGMREGDNMVLASLGEEVSVGEPLSTREAREEAIRALQPGSAYTNLYQGVIDGISLLSTNVTYHRNRCLVIFSDGEDDHRTGATREEAEEAIRTSTVPVYAVAVLRSGADASAREYGKQLRGFATVSLGGKGYTPVLDGVDSEEAGKEIWRSLQAASVISVDLDSLKYDGGKDELLLKAVYETGEARYEDTMALYTVDLPEQSPAGEPVSPEPASSQEPDSEEEAGSISGEDAGSSPGLDADSDERTGWDTHFPWIVLTFAAVGIVAVAVFLMVWRKKESEEETDAGGGAAAGETGGGLSWQEAVEEDTSQKPVADWQKSGPIWPTGGCRITLTAIGREKMSVTFHLMKCCARTVGRGSRADILLNRRDSRLSGVHCEMEWDGEKLYIRDKKSTNGSFVNGVPIQAELWIQLEDRAMLRIGSYEYRVRLERQ